MANAPLPKYSPAFLVTHTKADDSVQRIASKDVDVELTARMIVANTSTGESRVWYLDKNNEYVSYTTIATYSGWTCQSYHRLKDGTGRLIWNRTADGLCSLWVIGSTFGFVSEILYGPFSGWHCTSYWRNRDGTAGRMLWGNESSGSLSIWQLTSADAYASVETILTGYTGFTATSYCRPTPGTAKVLLTKDTESKLLTLDANDSLISTKTYSGVDSGWLAQSYCVNDNGTPHILWTNASTGEASLWNCDTNDDYVDGENYSLGANWIATSYTEVVP